MGELINELWGVAIALVVAAALYGELKKSD